MGPKIVEEPRLWGEKSLAAWLSGWNFMNGNELELNANNDDDDNDGGC